MAVEVTLKFIYKMPLGVPQQSPNRVYTILVCTVAHLPTFWYFSHNGTCLNKGTNRLKLVDCQVHLYSNKFKFLCSYILFYTLSIQVVLINIRRLTCHSGEKKSRARSMFEPRKTVDINILQRWRVNDLIYFGMILNKSTNSYFWNRYFNVKSWTM